MTEVAPARFGAVEAGGTKFVCLLGSSPDDIEARTRIPTGADPQATLAEVVAFFAGSTPPAAVGIASFGPVELRPRPPALRAHHLHPQARLARRRPRRPDPGGAGRADRLRHRRRGRRARRGPLGCGAGAVDLRLHDRRHRDRRRRGRRGPAGVGARARRDGTHRRAPPARRHLPGPLPLPRRLPGGHGRGRRDRGAVRPPRRAVSTATTCGRRSSGRPATWPRGCARSSTRSPRSAS